MKYYLPKSFEGKDMKLFNKGMTCGELLKLLNELPSKLPILLSSDEEMNTIFKGFYIQLGTDGFVFAGLSGCELEE